MADVIVYSKQNCPYCVHAKNLLSGKGIAFEELRIDLDADILADMQRITNNARTVPQIVIKGEPIGGFDDLKALNDSGKLDDLINQ
jgi:glutaredoxin 3